MTRPLYYFKLHTDIHTIGALSDGTQFAITGIVRKRRSRWLPAWLDDDVQFLSQTYLTTDQYKEALLKLEGSAFQHCEYLTVQEEKIKNMIELHETNLRKLNIGYKLIGWFRGMGDNGGEA